MAQIESLTTLAKTGIPGLDTVLGGGLHRDRLYLIEGDPGSGKTTLALQFLLEGERLGERGVYVTLSETREELLGVAHSHGWDLEPISICELVPSEDSLLEDAQTRMFHPSEVQLSDTTRMVLDQIRKVNPMRVVFDSLSEMRLLAQSPLRYRRQILALKLFFVGRRCTVLLLDDKTSEPTDTQLQSLAHGVLSLEHPAKEYGPERRRLRIVKIRGMQFKGGYHDFIIRRGGLDVFPRLVAADHRIDFVNEPVKSGIVHLDQLLGGGLDRGRSVLLMGPAGSGKSSIATQYMTALAENGESSAAFIFDESRDTLVARAEGLGQPMRRHLESGLISIQQVDPAELSPGELAHAVRDAVETKQVRMVMIDSLNGYLQAMPEERFLIIQLHELLTYLGGRGVISMLVVAQHGLIGTHMQTPIDASYLADTVLMLRYFELQGRLRRALSVLKKRSGGHEDALRELVMDSGRLEVGDSLAKYHGILSGTPVPLAGA